LKRLEQIAAQNAMVFKATRLAALRDAPTAFESKYEDELLLTDEEWIERAVKWDGIRFLAKEDGCYCGIAAGVLDYRDSSRAYLLSMWVAPTHRQKGIGRMLVTAVQEWANSVDAGSLVLDVTSNNSTAIAFYQSLSFAMTGKTSPYCNDSSLLEYEMSLPLR
jgi:ribosomal protein S18 acetylase RimI-like enzyme